MQPKLNVSFLVFMIVLQKGQSTTNIDKVDHLVRTIYRALIFFGCSRTEINDFYAHVQEYVYCIGQPRSVYEELPKSLRGDKLQYTLNEISVFYAIVSQMTDNVTIKQEWVGTIFRYLVRGTPKNSNIPFSEVKLDTLNDILESIDEMGLDTTFMSLPDVIACLLQV